MKFYRSSSIVFLVILISNLRIQAQGNNCEGAVQITNLINYCSNAGQFTNVNADASIQPIPACWPANVTADVWFTL